MSDTPKAKYYEWESSDGGGEVFDVNDVFKVFSYAYNEGLSIREMFDLFTFPDYRPFAGTDIYELPDRKSNVLTDRSEVIQRAENFLSPLSSVAVESETLVTTESDRELCAALKIIRENGGADEEAMGVLSGRIVARIGVFLLHISPFGKLHYATHNFEIEAQNHFRSLKGLKSMGGSQK